MNKKQPPILELSYRTTMPVTQIRLFPSDGAYPVCPRCAISLDREYQRFCDRCGRAGPDCRKADPVPVEIEPGHWVKCLHAGKERAADGATS